MEKELDAVNNLSLKYMDYKSIKEVCKENDMYETDELNEVLYLQMKGFNNINGLSPFFNLKCLFLNNNCIKKIENLDGLPSLKSLYLQNNNISCIENLTCSNLLILNLSNNKIKKIENLKHLKFLQTLNISNNLIENVSDIQELTELKNLSHLDISSNNLKLGSDTNHGNVSNYETGQPGDEPGSIFCDTDKQISVEKCDEVSKQKNKISFIENGNKESMKGLYKSERENKNEKESENENESGNKNEKESENKRECFDNDLEQFSEYLNLYENLGKERNKIDDTVEELQYYENWESMNDTTKKSFHYLCEFILLLKKIKKLKTLIMNNNPLTADIRYITKYVIANIPRLAFLDDKRIKKEDIILCQIFLKKGPHEERELKKILEKKKLEKYKNLTEKFHSFLTSRENVQPQESEQ